MNERVYTLSVIFRLVTGEYSMNKIIRKIMRFINRHNILWKLFIKFNWYKKILNKQAHYVLEGK